MINKDFEQILVGSLLGDGCLSIYRRCINPVYAECHSVKQLEYLKWKNKFFECKIKPRVTYLKKTNKYYSEYYLRTKANSAFLPYYYLFYKNGKKTISQHILQTLKPKGIAIWFCDDGSYSYYNSNIKISLMPLRDTQKRLISQHFKREFYINFKFQKEYMYLNSNDSKKFIKIIKKYVPRCMYYKLGIDFKKKELHREINRDRRRIFWERIKKNPELRERERARNRLAMRKLRAEPTYREICRKKDRKYKRKRYRNDLQYREKVLSRGREYWKKMREVLAKSKNYQIT